jgi:hypothetical protein
MARTRLTSTISGRAIGSSDGGLQPSGSFGNFGAQPPGQWMQLPRVLVARLLPIGHRRRRRELFEGKRADAHAGIGRHGHSAQIAQLQRGLAGPPRIEQTGRAVYDNADAPRVERPSRRPSTPASNSSDSSVMASTKSRGCSKNVSPAGTSMVRMMCCRFGRDLDLPSFDVGLDVYIRQNQCGASG